MAELQKELSVVAQDAAQQIYFRELGLQIAISYIANTISKCEFKVYEKHKEVQNELYYMLNVSPNPNQSSSQFLNALVTRYYRNGKVLVFPDSSKNRLYVADGFSMEEKPFSENILRTISIENETLKRKYKASEVFYFRLDDVRIKSLIDGAADQYVTVMQSAVDGFLRRNGKKYKALKFMPTLITGDLFENEDDMAVYVSDDDNHIPLLIEAKIKVGSVKAMLNTIENSKYPLSSLIKN